MLLVKKAGVKPDVEVSLSSRDPQSAFTPVVQDMKAKGSNFSYLTMSLNSAIQLRQEAALQGIQSDDVTWLCPSTCYDHEAMAAAGSTMNGEQVYLTFLPFEEVKSNKMLANFVKYTGKDNIDGFGVSAWAAAMLFQQALTDAVKDDGVNGVTRANLFTALRRHGSVRRWRSGQRRRHRQEGREPLLPVARVQRRQVHAGAPHQEGHVRLHQVELRDRRGQHVGVTVVRFARARVHC